jgi:hypothetical protein
MESNKNNLKFINFRVNPEIIKRIKNDPQLNDIQSYLNNNPGLIENQVKLYQIDNNTIAFNKIDFNKIISKIRDIYNNELLEKEKIPSPSLDDDFSDMEDGIQLTTRVKGGLKNRSRFNKKRSLKNNKFTPRYKKKTQRRKRKLRTKKNKIHS